MTDSNEKSDTDMAENSSPVKPPLTVRIKRFLLRAADRRPAYRIKKGHIVQEWYDFSRPDTLPFDTDTYNETQLFIGNYANPWHVDIDAIAENYDRFTGDEPIKNLIKDKHVIPSQVYKSYMNQGVLDHTFGATTLGSDRVQYLLYITIGIGILNLLIVVT